MDSAEDFVPLKNNPGAIVSIDIDGLNAYKEQRKAYLLGLVPKEEKNEINILKDDVNDLKNQISDIKNLLIKVLESK